jgi:hypothetical protein
MPIKYLFLVLFTLVSCGKEIKIDSAKLESYSDLQKSDSLKVDSTGTLIRTASADQLQADGKTYNVSKYSSYVALEFIAAKPIGSQILVKYKGTLKGNDLVLELLEAQ